MTTTITTFGCRRRASTRWIVADSSGGAVTIAIRSVTWARAEVVSRIASSTSRCSCGSSSSTPVPTAPLGARLEQQVDVAAVAGVGGHAPGRGVRVGQESGLLERGELRSHRRGPPLEPLAARRSPSTRPACRSPGRRRRPAAESALGVPKARLDSRKRQKTGGFAGAAHVPSRIGTIRAHGADQSRSSASALRITWLSPWAATVSMTTRSPPASLTVPVTTISGLGDAHAAELDGEALQRLRVAAGDGVVGPRDEAHHVEPVEDVAGEANRPGELGVDVDRVEVARGPRVAVGQVLVRGDAAARGSGRRPSGRPSHTPLTMLVQTPRTTWSPSWLTDVDSKT